MYKIGLTGGMGSGKSLVARVFNELFIIPVFYADNEAKKLMHENPELKQAIIELFGSASYDENGMLNRPYLAEKIFNHNSLREKLNQKVHAEVRNQFEKWTNRQNAPYILHEAAIMIESGFYQHMDKLITVNAPIEQKIERIEERDKMSKEQILQRMKVQLSDEERSQHADFIITNDNHHSVVSQVKSIHLKLIAHG